MKIKKAQLLSALFSAILCLPVMGMEQQKKEEQTIRRSARIADQKKRNQKYENKDKNKPHSPVAPKRQKIDEQRSLGRARLDTAHFTNPENQTSCYQYPHIKKDIHMKQLTEKFATLMIQYTVPTKQSVTDFLRKKPSSDEDMNDVMSYHDHPQEEYRQNKQFDSIQQISAHDQYIGNRNTENVTMMDVNNTKPKWTSGPQIVLNPNTNDHYTIVVSDDSDGDQRVLKKATLFQKP